MPISAFARRALNKIARVVLETFGSLGVFPDLCNGLRFRLWMRKLHGAFEDDVQQRLYGKAQPVILSGPFAGMQFLKPPVYGKITARWVGAYEEQVLPFINKVISRKYPTIIDVGASEGYYAVGLARALPESVVHTFDTDPIACRQLRQLAHLNGVKNIRQHGFCNPSDLAHLVIGETFLLVDIEGFEADFLNPAISPALLRTDILVEIHSTRELSHEALISLIRDRFIASHEITILEEGPRDVAAYKRVCRNLLTDDEVAHAIDEHRGIKQHWLWMERRGAAA